MPSSPRRLALAAFALGAALASAHCAQDTDAPPAAADSGCCELTPNPQLPAGMGRIVVSYPDDAGSTRIAVYAAGDTSKELEGDYGDVTFDIAPGTYDATVGGARVAGIPVQAAHDTRIRVGVLHVFATDGTRVDLLDASGATINGDYGEDLFGLPIGSIVVQVTGERETMPIEDGKVTEFRSLGRVVVAYPAEVSARIDVFKPGETRAIVSGYGDAAFDLFPGVYDVAISGKRIAGVNVQSAQDTHIEVGLLRVNASEGTRIDLLDADKKAFASEYGSPTFGLPVGEVGVQIAGQTETVTIEAGQVTEF